MFKKYNMCHIADTTGDANKIANLIKFDFCFNSKKILTSL